MDKQTLKLANKFVLQLVKTIEGRAHSKVMNLKVVVAIESLK